MDNKHPIQYKPRISNEYVLTFFTADGSFLFFLFLLAIRKDTVYKLM